MKLLISILVFGLPLFGCSEKTLLVSTPLVPQTEEAEQGYPNQFSPSSKITFSLDEPSHVLLTLFDLEGDEVETLIDAYLNAGDHTIILESGRFPYGLYFYRFKTKDYTATTWLVIQE